MPKLRQCKAEGARTVLVLESDDVALTSFDLIGDQLPVVLAKRPDAPDDIFLVQTDIDPWCVWPMKEDDDHWPVVGMREWCPAALQSDELFNEHLGQWAPATFRKSELVDLTSGIGA